MNVRKNRKRVIILYIIILSGGELRLTKHLTFNN